ncbi:two-component system response regulator CreB [Pseudomonas prosekii]|uniref:two-component system response regulator CreB n=2 Tax=Pseudomonas TaxID=286 RepID=UPI00387B461F
MPHILIVEDEAAIADTLIFALQGEGFTTTWLSLGAAALEHQRETPADLIILDIGLPDISGFETCKQLRRFSEVPVIFLSARDAEIDRVVGLEIGADDYVVKPFSPREVAARVRAILKRMAPRAVAEVAATSTQTPAPAPAPAPTPMLFRIDSERVQISYRGQLLSLTRHEFRLLQCLLEQPERVFSREQLLDALGVPADAGYERSIDSHIKSVRAKLRLVRAEAEPIQTHRGLGYSYSPGHS